MKRKAGSHNQGFTLIEIIAVLVILLLTAGVAIPSMTGFIKHSKQVARMETARSIFQAAQTGLNQQYIQDGRYEESAPGSVIAPTYSEAIWTMTPAQQENETSLVYLTFGMGEGGPNNKLYTLLEPYLNDKSALNGAILLEYNKLTGNALSVFYREAGQAGEIYTFGYVGANYNVGNRSSRSDDALAEAEVGYFGVDSVGDPIGSIPIEPVHVMLEDRTNPAIQGYGLLLAHCELPAIRRNDFVYNLTLEGPGGSATVSVAETGDGSDPTPTVSGPDNQIKNTMAQALADPFTVTVDGTERKLVVWQDNVNNVLTLHFVLDGVHPSLSLWKNYPGLGAGTLSATFMATDGFTQSELATSNENVHTLFNGAGDTANSYTVTSVRHLNNVRWVPGGVYQQTMDVPAINYDLSDTLIFPPLCSAADQTTLNASTLGFTGTYDGENNRIYSLRTGNADAPVYDNAGLFDTIASGAHVENVSVTSIVSDPNPSEISNTVSARVKAGGIAAVNDGTISKCTFVGTVVTPNERPGGVGGDALAGAGGIAGVNDGVITQCFAGATIHGYDAVGGVAGVNRDRISYCEVATSCMDSTLYGNPYYGAREGAAAYFNLEGSGHSYPDNNGFIISVLNSDGSSGGIAGIMQNGGSVTYCVNAARVEAGNDENATADSNKAGGGIVGTMDCGRNDYFLSNNINAGSVFASGPAGGVVGHLVSGYVYACYNNGYVNVVYTDTSPRTVKWTRNTGNLRAGGIVGHSEPSTNVDRCYSTQYCGNPYGGGFGVLRGNASDCAFLANYQNPSAAFRRTVNGNPSASTSRLERVGTEALRSLDTLSDSLTPAQQPFRSNTGNGVGWLYTYGGRSNPYLYPYLHVSNNDCDLGTNFHRTVNFPVVSEFGMIRLIDVTPQGETSSRVEMDLYMMQDAAVRIELDITVNMPLLGAVVFPYVYSLTNSQIENLRKGAADYTLSYDPGIGPEISLKFAKRSPMNSVRDKKAIALGYTSVITATSTQLGWQGTMFNGLDRLSYTAELYGGSPRTLYSSSTVQRGGTFEPNGLTLTRAPIDIGNSQTLECIYADLDMAVDGSCVIAVVDNTTGNIVKEIPVNRSVMLSNPPRNFPDAFTTSGCRLNALDGPGMYVLYEPSGSKYRLVLATMTGNQTYNELLWNNGIEGLVQGIPPEPATKTFHVDGYVSGVKVISSSPILIP